jgi:adenylate cyclase class 2
MMKEIEVKILEIDPKEIVAKLKELGVKKIEAGHQSAVVFDYPDNKLLKEKSVLRLRTIGNRTELTLKKKIAKGEYKVMEEIETTVGDSETVVRIFEELGMKSKKYEKYRATYKLGNTKLEMDRCPSVPWFIEIEAPSEGEVKDAVEKLGFSMSQATSMTGFDLIKKYNVTEPYSFAAKGESPDYDNIFQ